MSCWVFSAVFTTFSGANTSRFRRKSLFRIKSNESRSALQAILDARELGPQIIDWVVWHSLKLQTPVPSLLAFLSKLLDPSTDGVLRSNVAALLARFLPCLAGQPFTASLVTFVGDVFAGNTFRNVRLERCKFWNLDLSGTSFDNCAFSQCVFGDIRLDAATKISGSQFLDCQFTSLELGHEQVALFAPAEIDKHLQNLGGAVTRTTAVAVAPSRLCDFGGGDPCR
jgi:hypothetical protein